MATDRLYWAQPYATEFEAHITEFRKVNDKTGVVLDKTLFHPEAGGQPCDTGQLSILDGALEDALGVRELQVADVVEDGEAVVHLVCAESASSADNPGAGFPGLPAMPDGGWRVEGRIDWERRFDLMQQHTGQHILSRAFEEVLDANTTGFHLAKDYVSIDLDIPGATAAELAKVEDRANQVVFLNVPVTVKEYKRGELPKELRGRFEIDADFIRVVCVGEFDANPCGGTHLSSSGEVGLIKMNQTDRAHGGLRVVFRCGGRALADYRERQFLLDETARALSLGVQAVPSAVKALAEKVQLLQEGYEQAQEDLLELEIEALTRPERTEGQDCLVFELPSKSPDKLKYAAKKIVDKTGKLTVCFTGEPRFAAVVMSPFPNGPDARSIVSAIGDKFGGRGGGSPQMAQLGSKEPLVVDAAAVAESIKSICRGIL